MSFWGTTAAKLNPFSTGACSLELPLEVIGRGAAGKSILWDAIRKSVADNYTDSGLYVSCGDPRATATAINTVRRTEDGQRQRVNGSTMETPAFSFEVLHEMSPVLKLNCREAIGQLIGTDNAAGNDQLVAYRQYVKELNQAGIVWVIVPAPPANPTDADRRRWEIDVRLANSFLTQVARSRGDQPLTVTLILTKTDVCCPTAEDVPTILDRPALASLLRPLLMTVKNAGCIQEAAIIPVSSFGFGNAVPIAKTGGPAEVLHLLKPEAELTPYNVFPLIVYTLLAGIMPLEAPGQRHEALYAQVARMLSEDLASLAGYIVPLKGKLAR